MINTSSVFQWNTSSLHAAKDSFMSHENKWQEKAKLRIFIDGTNAPEITVKLRYKSLKFSHSKGPKDPRSASAVFVGLRMIQ